MVATNGANIAPRGKHAAYTSNKTAVRRKMFSGGKDVCLTSVAGESTKNPGLKSTSSPVSADKIDNEVEIDFDSQIWF